jgi:hypothetical protein
VAGRRRVQRVRVCSCSDRTACPLTPQIPQGRRRLLIAGVAAGVALAFCLAAAWPGATPRRQRESAGSADEDRVLVELFVMSKCPDANYCEHYLARTLERLSPIVHVRAE